MATNNALPPTPAHTTVDSSHSPVVVNLRAAINASGEVVVFGPSEESVENVLWCEATLNYTALYEDASNAMFEFWEPSDACGNILGRIAKAGGNNASDIDRNALTKAGEFRDSLHSVLNSRVDASAANPFMHYAGNEDYTRYDNFGRLVLAYAAEGMFGHPSATAAITNDEAIVEAFNKENTASAAAAETATHSNQALAQRLAAALYNLTDTQATEVVQVVLGQDANRAINADNSQLQTDSHAPLKFFPDDVIYVKITLEAFTSQLGSAGTYLSSMYTPLPPAKQDYYLRIVLA